MSLPEYRKEMIKGRVRSFNRERLRRRKEPIETSRGGKDAKKEEGKMEMRRSKKIVW